MWLRARHPRCDFCGRLQDEVAQLVAGVGGYICNDCVTVAAETINPPAPARTVQTLTDGEAVTVRQSVTESLALTAISRVTEAILEPVG